MKQNHSLFTATFQQSGFQQNQSPRNHSERGRPPNPPNQNQQFYGSQTGAGVSNLSQQQQLQQVQQPQVQSSQQQRNLNRITGPNTVQQRANTQQQQQQKKPRYFVAMFDYDPTTMSPNPDGCDEELPFQEGDTIKVVLFVLCVFACSNQILKNTITKSKFINEIHRIFISTTE